MDAPSSRISVQAVHAIFIQLNAASPPTKAWVQVYSVTADITKVKAAEEPLRVFGVLESQVPGMGLSL